MFLYVAQWIVSLNGKLKSREKWFFVYINGEGEKLLLTRQYNVILIVLLYYLLEKNRLILSVDITDVM